MVRLAARPRGDFVGRKQAGNINIKELRLFGRPSDLAAVASMCESDMAGRVKVRVPNPAKPLKGRLDAPPVKPHLVKKKYRRRPKHPGRGAT